MKKNSQVLAQDKKNPLFQIRGNSICLTPLQKRHISLRYAAWFADPEVCQFNRHGARALSLNDVREYIRGAGKNPNLLVLAIHDSATQAHLGNVSLNNIDWENHSAEISILIGEKNTWGKGVGTEACQKVLDYATKRLKLHRVWMGMTSENTAMRNIAQKIGMTQEAVLRDSFFKNGKFHDILQYVFLSGTKRPNERLKIVLLMRYGNVMGLEYLDALIKQKVPVQAVIFQGDSYNEKDHKIVSERTQGLYQPLKLVEIKNSHKVPFFFVSKHNSKECEEILSRLSPDLIVLGGTDILTDSVIKMARIVTLNCHPGALPNYRGCSCVEWAIHNNDPVAATCHVVTAKIDAGPVVLSRTLPIYRKDNYPSIRARMIEHQAMTMVNGIKKVLKAKTVPKANPIQKGVYRRTMDASQLARVHQIILQKKYSHYAD